MTEHIPSKKNQGCNLSYLDKDSTITPQPPSTPFSNFDKIYIPTDKDKGIYIDKENNEPPVEFKMKTIEQREELNKQTDESVKEGFERVEEKADEVKEISAILRV
jgi:hypothetical protein